MGRDQEIASISLSKFWFQEGLGDMTDVRRHNVLRERLGARARSGVGLDDLVGIRPIVLYEKYDLNFPSTP